jgi:predicted RNA binding protein YcfA (HicA-like mRNA interferase family)
MSTKEKLIERFKQQPNDFTFDELVRLFQIFGFTIDNKGKTSGSRLLFEKNDKSYVVHRPHPSKIVKQYVMKQILDYLTCNGFIK